VKPSQTRSDGYGYTRPFQIKPSADRCSRSPEESEDGSKRRRLVGLTLKSYGHKMDEAKRATISFDADVHRALRLKAAACDRSISDMVNEAVRMTLAEDADDLRDADQRQAEPSACFEEFVTSLRDSGRI
jgi:plasmid stability protein